MDDRKRQRAERIFTEALEFADPPGRGAYLEGACTGNDVCRRFIQELSAWPRAAERDSTCSPIS